jgi:hypothetical protein
MSVIGGSIGVSPDQILATGDSFTAELANQPFAVQNLTYDAASSGTVTVTVGVGRIEWSDLQLDEFTSNQTVTQTSADSLGGNTYYVILNKGISAGTPTITLETSIPTTSDTGKLMLASYTLPATVSTSSNAILVDKRPQISKGGGGGLLSSNDTNVTISDTGSGSSIIFTIDGTTTGTFTGSTLDYNGVFIGANSFAINTTIASGKTAFTGGTVTVNNGVVLTLVGNLVIF